MKKVIWFIGLLSIGVMTFVFANTYQDNLKLGAKTTKRNYMNDPFVQPTKFTLMNLPETWAIYYNREPLDRSPKDKSSKIVTIGTGTPFPNPYRFGPASALVVNGYPYFIDCGEGWFRAVNRTIMTQKGIDGAEVFAVKNMKYMFLTHLHEDHTVGLPSFILSPYKIGPSVDKVIFGPQGTQNLVDSIVKGWRDDIQEMFQGSTHKTPAGSGVSVGNIYPPVDVAGPIFEDDNVKVEEFRTKHGALRYTFAYRFTTKPDNRVIVFGGDGRYSEGLADAAKGADVLVIESMTWKNLIDAPWGGDDLAEKRKQVGYYHLFPQDLKRIQEQSGVKEIVLIHEQNYSKPDKFELLGLLHEVQEAGVKNVYSAIDGDMY